MIKIEDLKKSSTQKDKDLLFLNDALISYFTTKVKGKKNKEVLININSTIRELSTQMEFQEPFNKKLKKKLEVSPESDKVLTQYINTIDNYYLGYETIDDENDLGEPVYYNVYNYPVLNKAFIDIIMGRDKYLYEYTSELIQNSLNGKQLNINSLEQIAKGVFIAYKRNEINEKLNTSSKPSATKPPMTGIVKNKLTWKGTPGQFAFIMDLLINKGYIEKPTRYAEKNAEILLEHFHFNLNKPSKGSLGRLLHTDVDPISNAEHKGRFLKIPHRNELDK